MAAARAFAERRNPGQRLALVTFNDKVNVVLPLTSDSKLIDAALAETPPLSTGTHIYDGLQQAGKLLQDAGIRGGSIVLLSDGKDVGSTIDQKAAIQSVTDAKARVFAVGLRSGQYDPDALRAIVGATSGTYSEASSSADLQQIYEQLGYTLSHEYLLHYRSLAGPSAKQVVAVKVAGIPGVARATYETPAIPVAAIATGPSAWDTVIRSTITQILVIFGIAGLLGFGVFRVVYRKDQELTRRIGQFVTLPEEARAKERQREVAETLAASPGEKTSNGRWADFEERVALAQIAIPPRTLGLMTIVGGVATGIVVSILIGSAWGLLAGLFAPLITNGIVNRRVRSIQRQFADQLPDNLDVVSSGLRSGHSFVGALAVCVDDAAEPSKSEFQRVIADEQLGVPIDEALHVVGQRMNNRDVVQIALVAKLQRDAGTNAADVLDQVSDNVRNRVELRRLVASLTAQGRMARWIVSLLPVVLFLGIYALDKSYLAPLWQEPAGIVGLIFALIMIIAGSLIIKRIVEIEV
jgi:tight adherence protein B